MAASSGSGWSARPGASGLPPLIRHAASALARSDSAWLVAGEGANRAGRFLLLLFVAREVGPESYGAWVLGAVLGTFLANTSDGGLALTATTAVGADAGSARRYTAFLWPVAALIAAVTAAAAFLLHQAAPGISPVVLLLAASGPLDSAAGMLLSPLRASGRMKVEAAIRGLEGLSFPIAGVAIGAASGDFNAAAVTFVLAAGGALALATLATFLVFGVMRPALDLPLRPMWSASAPVFLSSLLLFAYFRLDAVILSQLGGAKDTGLYGAAYNLTFCGTFVSVALGRGRLPALAGAAPGADLARRYIGSLKLVAACALASALALLAVAPFLTNIYGRAFAGSLPPYLVLTAAQALFFVTHLNYMTLVARGMANRAVLTTLFALAVNTGANLALIPVLGALGAALAMLVSESALLVLQARIVARLLSSAPAAPARQGESLAPAA